MDRFFARVVWLFDWAGVFALICAAGSLSLHFWFDGSAFTGALFLFGVFRWLALAAAPCLLGITLVQGLPLWGVLVVSTLMFAFVSGRMIPGMAILASAAQAPLRGTFMTLNASVQSAAMGVASVVGGMLISRDAQGLVQNYWMSAVVGITASLLSIVVVGRLHLHGATASAR